MGPRLFAPVVSVLAGCGLLVGLEPYEGGGSVDAGAEDARVADGAPADAAVADAPRADARAVGCARYPDASLCDDFDDAGALASPPWSFVYAVNGDSGVAEDPSAVSPPRVMSSTSASGSPSTAADFGLPRAPASVRVEMDVRVASPCSTSVELAFAQAEANSGGSARSAAFYATSSGVTLAGADVVDAVATARVDDGAWHHVTLSADFTKGTSALDVDFARVADNTIASPTFDATATRVQIGLIWADRTRDACDYRFDDVAVFVQ